jgi:adenosine kinase
LSGVDGCAVLIGNDYEFGMMARTAEITEQALIAMAPLTIITRGEEGSRVYVRGQAPVEVPIAKPLQMVDPTGAGDAYLGGLAYGLAKGLPMAVTGRIAALAATYCIELKGCQEHAYTRPEFVKRYAETFGEKLELA